MKKRAWKGLAIAAAAITLGAGLLFAGCDTQADGTDALSEVYAQAVELGYEGTLEDFIAQLRGEDGKDGVGISSATVNSEGHLILFFTDGNTVDCGAVVCGDTRAQKLPAIGGHVFVDENCIRCGKPLYEDEELIFALSDDGTYYRVVNLGGNKDVDLVIPSEYRGLPVKEL